MPLRHFFGRGNRVHHHCEDLDALPRDNGQHRKQSVGLQRIINLVLSFAIAGATTTAPTPLTAPVVCAKGSRSPACHFAVRGAADVTRRCRKIILARHLLSGGQRSRFCGRRRFWQPRGKPDYSVQVNILFDNCPFRKSPGVDASTNRAEATAFSSDRTGFSDHVRLYSENSWRLSCQSELLPQYLR